MADSVEDTEKDAIICRFCNWWEI